MPFPAIDGCVLCEVARAETGGKYTLLGFAGIAPNVELQVPKLDGPITVTFVIGGPAGTTGNASVVFEIIEKRTGRVIAQSTESAITWDTSKARASFAVQFVAPHHKVGVYRFRVLEHGAEAYGADYSIAQA